MEHNIYTWYALDDDVIKQNKCDEIINHYQQQIDLLQKYKITLILYVIEYML